MTATFSAVGPSSSGSGTAGTTTLTWSHPGGASDTCVYVGVAVGNNTDAGITCSVTFGGVSMTAVPAKVETGTGGAGFLQCFKLEGPPTGTQTVAVTASASSDLSGGSISVAGSAGTGTPWSNANTGGNTAAPTATSPGSVAATSLVVAFEASGQVVSSATAPSTSRFIKNLNSNTGAGNTAGATSPGTGAAVTTAWALSGSDFWAVVAFEALSAQPPVKPQPGSQQWRRRHRRSQQTTAPSAVPATVSPVVVPVTRQRPATVCRQPRMALTAVPVIAAPVVTVYATQATVQRRPRLVTRGRGIVTGPLAPGSAVTPVRPVILVTPRRGPPRPGTGKLVSGLRVDPRVSSFARSRQPRLVRQPAQRIARGERGSLTVPVPVPVDLVQRKRLARAPAQRLVMPPFVPAGVVYQPDPYPARFARPQYRLARQPRMRLATGMLPGRGLSGIPVQAVRQRPATVQRQARQRLATGFPGSVTRPVPLPVTLRVPRSAVRRSPSQLAAGRVVAAQVTAVIAVARRSQAKAVLPRQPRMFLAVPRYAAPPPVYPVVIQQARLRVQARRLARRLAGRVAPGLLPGTFVPPGSTGTADWRARPGPGRWLAVPGPARWTSGPAGARWDAVPAPSRWLAGPAPSRWRTDMQFFPPIAALSTAYVNVLWQSDLDGTSIDPTGQTTGQSALPVQMSFPPSSGRPDAPAQPVTWFAASWLLGGTGKGYYAQCLVGPGGGAVTLAAGQYDVWSKITGTPEVPAAFAGTLTVY